MKNWKIILFFIAGLAIILGCWSIFIPKHTLSIAAIMKNEKPYLKEWLEYHQLVGVEHFYLCDNDSNDGTEEYLQPYIKQRKITYIPLPGINRQNDCYKYIIENYKNKTKWLAIIDLDEFLVPLKTKSMQNFLKEFEDVDEVSLYWLNYGDNHLLKRQEGLVIETFTAHGKFLNHTVKSIVRPKQVMNLDNWGSEHYIQVKGKSVNENHDSVNFMLGFSPSAQKARVNHYILKSFEEFLHKKQRGHPQGTTIDYRYYFFHNENDIKEDKTMLRFLPELKKRMKNSPLPDVSIPRAKDLPSSFDEIYFSSEQASKIVGREIAHPINFNELTKVYKINYPNYKK